MQAQESPPVRGEAHASARVQELPPVGRFVSSAQRDGRHGSDRLTRIVKPLFLGLGGFLYPLSSYDVRGLTKRGVGFGFRNCNRFRARDGLRLGLRNRHRRRILPSAQRDGRHGSDRFACTVKPLLFGLRRFLYSLSSYDVRGLTKCGVSLSIRNRNPFRVRHRCVLALGHCYPGRFLTRVQRNGCQGAGKFAGIAKAHMFGLGRFFCPRRGEHHRRRRNRSRAKDLLFGRKGLQRLIRSTWRLQDGRNFFVLPRFCSGFTSMRGPKRGSPSVWIKRKPVDARRFTAAGCFFGWEAEAFPKKEEQVRASALRSEEVDPAAPQRCDLS